MHSKFVRPTRWRVWCLNHHLLWLLSKFFYLVFVLLDKLILEGFDLLRWFCASFTGGDFWLDHLLHDLFNGNFFWCWRWNWGLLRLLDFLFYSLLILLLVPLAFLRLFGFFSDWLFSWGFDNNCWLRYNRGWCDCLCSFTLSLKLLLRLLLFLNLTLSWIWINNLHLLVLLFLE